MLPGVLLVLLGREPRADKGAGDRPPGVVAQVSLAAQDTARDRHRALAEHLYLGCGETVEVLFLLDLLPDHGLLDALETWIHRADPRRRVDVDHRGDTVRQLVARGVARKPGSAVNGEHHRDILCADGC